ncbi:MAG: hypothetical protein Q8S73_19250 [Deltaproteobacteria bacterium]|nr:hypothetical protein [Myxococcales bacterium]MDP3216254.1 hypothetical protein [Deltaproteobacteria bacterium]
MTTTKKSPGSKTKPAEAATTSAKPPMGSEVAARPAAKPRPKEVTSAKAAAGGGIIQQVDPLFVYDIRVFTGTTWLLLGEIWFDTAGTEYWGLYQDWATYNVAPNTWIYPIAYATTYSDLTAFKAKITSDDPNHNPSFLKITQTSV